ncbi:MAG: hypothetical protein IJT36_00845 [Alphaproteobacteria bacterium]|nr:hypothetical protein [Alphaproteobacteria bacterium]
MKERFLCRYHSNHSLTVVRVPTGGGSRSSLPADTWFSSASICFFFLS